MRTGYFTSRKRGTGLVALALGLAIRSFAHGDRRTGPPSLAAKPASQGSPAGRDPAGEAVNRITEGLWLGDVTMMLHAPRKAVAGRRSEQKLGATTALGRCRSPSGRSEKSAFTVWIGVK